MTPSEIEQKLAEIVSNATKLRCSAGQSCENCIKTAVRKAFELGQKYPNLRAVSFFAAHVVVSYHFKNVLMTA